MRPKNFHCCRSPLTKKGWLLPLSGLTESVKPWVKAFIGLTEEKTGCFFSRFDWFNSFKEVCVNPDFRVNQKGVRDVEQSNNSFENLVLAILQGSQRWQRSLNPLATLHQWDRPRLGRWHLHPAGRHNFYHSVDFSCFLRVSKLIQITAQMADESCPTGKSSERKCLILTLSARVSQSTRLGVLLVYWSAKVSSNHVLELYLT